MPLTERQIQKRWDANFRAVQDAKSAAAAARGAYRDACVALTAVTKKPGFRIRMFTGQLTDAEAAALAEAEDGRLTAYEAVVAADEVVEAAKERFKAGVPED